MARVFVIIAYCLAGFRTVETEKPRPSLPTRITPRRANKTNATVSLVSASRVIEFRSGDAPRGVLPVISGGRSAPGDGSCPGHPLPPHTQPISVAYVTRARFPRSATRARATIPCQVVVVVVGPSAVPGRNHRPPS